MGLMDKLRGEFIDIVEWLDDSRDTIVWRFPRYDNEIKMGAKLVVRESQTAVFVNEGQVADVFTPGTYTLETQNLPILSTLKGWKYGFNSPWKAEVYFVNTRPVHRPEVGHAEPRHGARPRVRHGPAAGVRRLRGPGHRRRRSCCASSSGTDPQFRTEEVQEYLRQMIVSRLGSALASARHPDARPRRAAADDRQPDRRRPHRGPRRRRPGDPEVHHREHLAAAGGRGGARQAHRRWACSATSTSTPSSRRPTRSRRPRTTPAAPARASASAWAWRWGSRWRAGCRRQQDQPPTGPAPGQAASAAGPAGRRRCPGRTPVVPRRRRPAGRARSTPSPSPRRRRRRAHPARRWCGRPA